MYLNKNCLIAKLEAFAPLDTQEKWDCCGWQVEHSDVVDVHKIMFALTVTDSVFEQAKALGCDLIIAHHPLFTVPLKYKDIQIYSAHTNMDKALGGTTDTILEKIGLQATSIEDEFVRVVKLEAPMLVDELKDLLKTISPKLRYVNNLNVEDISSIAFCAGSGGDFIEHIDVDAFVTGDLKYHTACETEKVVFDIGHFESEVLIKEKFSKILGVEGVMADEKTPFI